eukprot:scaffold6441_cov115-Skeletonema_dohrnii-CCMP3373.AAC.6
MCNYKLAVHNCHIHSVRYDMEVECGARLVLTTIPNRSSSGHLRRCSDADTSNQCLYYHGQL